MKLCLQASSQEKTISCCTQILFFWCLQICKKKFNQTKIPPQPPRSQNKTTSQQFSLPIAIKSTARAFSNLLSSSFTPSPHLNSSDSKQIWYKRTTLKSYLKILRSVKAHSARTGKSRWVPQQGPLVLLSRIRKEAIWMQKSLRHREPRSWKKPAVTVAMTMTWLMFLLIRRISKILFVIKFIKSFKHPRQRFSSPTSKNSAASKK